MSLFDYEQYFVKNEFYTDLTDKRTDAHGLSHRLIRENP